MKIGSNEFKYGLFLAPMAGVTDRSFRALCAEQGAECVTTEMISAKAVCYGDAKTWRLASTEGEACPSAVQIFGSDPSVMATAAAEIAERLSLAYIDINMGCPMPKITKNGEGSALMEDPKLCGRIVRAVADAVSVPVTAKIRAGRDAAHINAVAVARECEANGASALFVHGRTAEQLYSGTSDPSVVRAVAAAVSVPVVGNGDIFSPEAAVGMLRDTGCAGVMVARGSLGDPWLFARIRAAFAGEAYDEPSADEKRALVRKHIAMHLEDKGERSLPEMRKHLSWYSKGVPGSAALRRKINSAATEKDLNEAADAIF